MNDLIFCRCSLFIVQGEAGTESHCLVSDLFDVNVSSTVEEMNKKTEIRIPWGKKQINFFFHVKKCTCIFSIQIFVFTNFFSGSGIVGHVAASGKPVNITDCYADERFNPVSHQFSSQNIQKYVKMCKFFGGKSTTMFYFNSNKKD